MKCYGVKFDFFEFNENITLEDECSKFILHDNSCYMRYTFEMIFMEAFYSKI